MRTALLAALVAPALLSSSTGLQDEFHQTYRLTPHGRVALENINGDVHIIAWDRDEVEIRAIKRGYSQERVEDARIQVDSTPDAITIKTCYPGFYDNNHHAAVEYRVMVPRHAHLTDVKLVNGALAISGVAGDVHASSVNGTIKAERLAGETRLSTVNGMLQAVFDRLDPAKPISLNSVSGSIELLLPFDARAEFKADTVSGGIENEFGLPADRGRNHLAASLRGGGTRIRLNNVNGTITIIPAWRGRRLRFT